MLIEEYELCLSIQRALLDRITPNLRRISFEMEQNLINLYFIYDDIPTELEEELSHDAAGEIIADFLETFKINCDLKNVKYPQKMNSKGHIIFNRYEGFS